MNSSLHFSLQAGAQLLLCRICSRSGSEQLAHHVQDDFGMKQKSLESTTHRNMLLHPHAINPHQRLRCHKSSFVPLASLFYVYFLRSNVKLLLEFAL